MSVIDMSAVDGCGERRDHPSRRAAESQADPDPSPRRGRDWRELASCKGQTELFFAKKAERPQARQRREAKAERLCASCPVQSPCRAFARANHEYGFWAGENEEQRHGLGYTVSAPIGIRARQPESRPAAAQTALAG